MLVFDGLLVFARFQIDIPHEERNLVLFVQAVPHHVRELLQRQLDADAFRLAAEREQRVAVAQVGMDKMAQPRHRFVIFIEKALVRGPVGGKVFENRQAVRAVLVDHAGNAGGIVGRVRLKLAGAQGVDIAFSLPQIVADRIRLVAVGHDRPTRADTDRMINNQGGVGHSGRVKRFRADSILGFHKHAVPAVLRPAHDEIGRNVPFVILCTAENDAAARIGVGHQLIRDIEHIFAHNANTLLCYFLLTAAPSTVSLPAQKSDTACGSSCHSA